VTISERGGPAFPADFAGSNWLGLTAIDYMAAAALTGIMSKYEVRDARDLAKIASLAYATAQEMVKIHNKITESPCPEVDPLL